MPVRSGSLVFAICALPRILALFLFPPDTSVYYYWEASGSILASGAFTEPLYPAVLAVLRFVAGNRLLLVLLGQIAIAAAGGLLLYRLTEELGGRWSAIVATALYAFDPYLVRQSVSFVEITLCTTLLIAAVRALTASSAVLGGFALALAALTRFSLLPVALGAVVVFLWRGQRRHAAVLATAVLIPVGGWMVWSHGAYGSVAPARIGVNLFVSTSEYADRVGPLRNVDFLVPFAYDTIAAEMPSTVATETEKERLQDALLLRHAIAFVRRQPLRTLQLKLRNLALSFAPVLLPLDKKPRGATAAIEGGIVTFHGIEKRPLHEHVVYSVTRTLLLIGACAGLLMRRPRHPGEAFLLVTAASVIAVTTVFFPTSRLLAPMAFVMMVYSGIAITSSTSRAPRRP